ncbi:hypothetical protein B7P43_G04160 [Cryptotermes secundus]|uniref:Ionotropic glutamate receptor C-terminal domain-containing protein n=2 Tax=Cryptotermes secundus TaxID=105785 RepID=A0A2J7QXU4_9NEOP|nr:hypothetical protein B7P43_G04160 [Cryptotermes secundus]
MDCTKFISEQHFTPAHPVVIVLPPTEEDSTTEEVGYLITALHTSSRWPLLLFNTTYEMKGKMNTEIYQHGNYIILISGSCRNFDEYMEKFSKQLAGLAYGNVQHSWNPRAKFILPVMSACTDYNTTYLSGAILSKLWLYKVTNSVVLFLESNGHITKFLQRNETGSAPNVRLSLHTWFPYENSQSCNPIDGTVPIRVFFLRNVSDIHRGEIFRGYIGKNLHRCPIRILARVKPPFVFIPNRIWLNASGRYTLVYNKGWDIGIISAISDSLNLSVVVLPARYPRSKSVRNFVSVNILSAELVKGRADIVIGQVLREEIFSHSLETTRSYYSMRIAWCTPCATKYPRWTRIFRIFSVYLWIYFILSLVLAIITVICISNYGHKFHLPEFGLYRDIISVTANVTAVALGISVATKPRTSSLRVFFFSWVCHSLAMSTVFQAYLTSFLIDTGYEEPIRTVEEMLNAGMRFGFPPSYKMFFNDSTDSIGEAILRKVTLCPDEGICLKWASEGRNISTLRSDMTTEFMHSIGSSTDDNNRPLLCDLEDGVVVYFQAVMAVLKGNPLLEHINDVIDRIVEGGLFKEWKKLFFNHARVAKKAPSSYTLADTYLNISLIHMQSAFYLFLLGHAAALFSFVIEMVWNSRASKQREATG